MLPPLHMLLFPISSIGFVICTIQQIRYISHDFCNTSRGALAGTRSSWNMSWERSKELERLVLFNLA